MTSYEGKTDEVLHIKLPSSFLHAIWLADEIAINGKSYLEVLTHWVGNKAPIKITIKDLQGKVVHVKEDEINNNLYQFLYAPSSTNNTGGVTFEVELPVHKKKTMGNLLRIGKPVEISALRFTDFNSEKTLTEIMERVPVACEAKVKGMPGDAKALISVYLRLNSAAQRGALLVEAEVPVEDGKAILYFDPNINNRIAAIKVQQELNKEYGTYLQPEYYFEVITGGVAALSGPAKAVQNMTMHFWEMPNVAGTLEGKKVTIVYPDGKKEEKTIPKDGNIEFPKTLPGKHKVVMEKSVKIVIDNQTDPKMVTPVIDFTKSIETSWQGFPHQNDYNDIILEACKKHLIEPLLFKSLIAKESSFDKAANNEVGFAGLTQIGGAAIKEASLNIGTTSKSTGEWVFDFDKDERFIPKKSIFAGALIFANKRRTLNKLIFRKFKSPPLEIEKQKFYVAAYNAGQGTIYNAWKAKGGIDCTWDDLISEISTSALWKVIPESWVKKDKYNEITKYVKIILERIA